MPTPSLATLTEEQQLIVSEVRRFVDKLSRGWMSLGGILNTHTMVSWMIKTYCSEDVKSRLLPAMAAGEKRAGLCMTEANAGSDLQAITMTAVPDADDYVLNAT